MPWSIVERNNEFCVVKESDGSVEGCHDRREDALTQQRALYASENKQLDGFIHYLLDTVKSIFKRKEQTTVDEVDGGLMFFKGVDGQLKWVARYSNNFRDDDRPAEIISSTSHRKFAALVKEGIVNPPDLWLWHIPEWRWGIGQWAVYDDTGFALAGGDVIPGFEPLAEALAAHDKEIGVSHGMPAWSIERDENDVSIITGHITEEVSPLPLWSAANKMTSFAIIKEATPMAIEQADKARLMEKYDITAEMLEKLEQFNALDAQKSTRESKEVNANEPETTTPEAEAAEETAAEVVAEVETEVADTGEADVKELLSQLVKSVLALNERQEVLFSEVKSLKESDTVKVAKQVTNSPLAGLTASLASVIGQDSTRVDGRTSLAKSGPEENAVEVHQYTPIPFINQMIANEKGGQ